MLKISQIDHIVLTVKNIPSTVEFYTQVLGMHLVSFSDNRSALVFGNQKINLHKAGNEFEPKAHAATPGSADLCLITEMKLEQAMFYVKSCGVKIIQEPVKRTGATTELLSFYIRDPDLNLIEISNSL